MYIMTTVVHNYSEISLYDLSFYKSRKDMDITAIEINKYLNPKEYALLNYIRQKSSVRSIGVVSLLHKTIAGHLDWSVSKLKRYIKRLISKGAIIVENSIRPVKKGYGACIYIVPPLHHFKKVYAGYLKRQNELSEMNYRKEHLERRQKQQEQALAYISKKEQTMSSYYYTLRLSSNSIANNNHNGKTDYQIRKENIRNARIKPTGFPEELYYQFKPFFSDKQLLQLYKVMKNSIKDFIYGKYALNFDEVISVMNNSLNSVVRALRRQEREGVKVENIFGYAKSVAFAGAFNIFEYGTIDRFFKHF